MEKEKPQCPECPEDADYSVEKGAARKTMVSGPSATWDESGNFHPSIDPNTIKQTYRCSNGHKWQESIPADPKVEEKREARRKARERGDL